MGLLFVNGICYSDSSETNGVIPITWDQYSNLTEEQKMNDTPYYITDAPSGYALASKTRTMTTPTSLATFNASAMPMPTLKASIKAQQDLHGYDKPWVGGAGKNKLPLTVTGIKASNTSGTWNGDVYTIGDATFTIKTDSDGNVTSIEGKNTSSTSRVLQLNFTLNAGTYILTSGFNEYFGSIDTLITKDNATIARGNPTSPGQTFTLSEASAIVWNFRITTATRICAPMIRLATETDATFAPYSNICPISGWDNAIVTDTDDVDNPTVTQTTTISLGQTVYGGELDVVNGVLKVTWKSVDMGSLTWSYSPTYTRFSSSGVQDEIKSGNNQDEVMCSCYGNEANVDMNAFKTTTGLIMVKDSRYTDTTDFKQSVTGQQFVYMLETPIIIPLTPSLIKSLNGTNNLSVDCGEILEGEYLAPLGTDIAMNNQLYGAGEAVLSEYSNKAETVLQKQLSDTSMHQILLSSDTTSNDGYYEVGKTANLYHQKYGSPGYGISTITLIDPNTTPANTLHAAELSVDEANDTSLHLFKRVNTSSQMEGMTITTTDAILNGSTWDGTNTSLKDAVSKIIIVNVTNFDSTNNLVTLDRTYTEIETLLEDGHIVVIYYDYNNASLIEFRLRLFYYGSRRAMRFDEMPNLTSQNNTLNISFASIRQTLSGSTDTNQFIYDNTTYTIPLNT